MFASVLFSCTESSKKKECTLEFNFSKWTCSPLEINIGASGILGNSMRYSIWQNYGVYVYRAEINSKYDSCYFSGLEEYVKRNLGDSVFILLNDDVSQYLSDTNLLRGIQYQDGVFCSLLNSSFINGKGAELINKSLYYHQCDSLGMLDDFLHDVETLRFWVTVNNQGRLGNIEVIASEDCSTELEGILERVFKDTEWSPANYNDENVSYRYLESIYQ